MTFNIKAILQDFYKFVFSLGYQELQIIFPDSKELDAFNARQQSAMRLGSYSNVTFIMLLEDPYFDKIVQHFFVKNKNISATAIAELVACNVLDRHKLDFLSDSKKADVDKILDDYYNSNYLLEQDFVDSIF